MNEMIEKDLKYVWHPYTQMKDCESLPPILVKEARGVKIFDTDGKFYYDTISSWWCNVHGHNHPRINDAIKKQLELFEHVMFAGFTHEGAVTLAEKLVEITPSGLEKVFFSDNGSTAVEAALKMSFQYWKNTGKPGKNKFISLDKAYHGDTIGAMSVSGVSLFNEKFEELFFKTYKVPTPYCYRCPVEKDRSACNVECVLEMEKILKKDADKIAAIILEPILMGAAGMIIYPAEYLKKVRHLAHKYNVHLIADEVASGFGRTGKMFACGHAEIAPDIMCLSKGITSGYLALGATLATDEIFSAFYDEYDKFKTFYHGHTFTANPLACAAALASLEIFETENVLENAKSIENMLKSFLAELKNFSMIGDVRIKGTVGALELVKNKKTKEPYDAKERMGFNIYKLGLENGLVLRPLGDVVYFFLPLCVNSDELKDIFRRTRRVLELASNLEIKI